MKYLTRWRSKRKAPGIPDKYQAPEPEEIQIQQPAQPNDAAAVPGPPSIHATWFNVHDHSDFRSISINLPATMDEITIAIGNHVKDGAYHIVSMSASAYSITVVCSTERSRVEFGELVQKMKGEVGKNGIISPEELMLLREWEAKWGVVEQMPTVEGVLDWDSEPNHRVLSARQSTTDVSGRRDWN
ncbi:uncharacterized protein BDW43DRAFT_10708 [Aspergillus alliaceus]|uniref:uncharacterized protein n=1 Tax=Petromyces alliaceus TaxID=209559 RepID=UPI0012A6C807|nr:uncharacterized protein BDW43DRAFT_10708 [Aspergillus alliaceus]KAB8239729.1 hypothetical protein BDW43DRAFT_10708 [Aspergillus alliaceus]